jgi:hypothetical protein
MIIIPAIIKEDGSVHLPEHIELPIHYASFCDDLNYYFFETKEEADTFYLQKGIIKT